MSRFIVACAPVTLADPMTGKALTELRDGLMVAQVMPWSACVRALFSDARLQKMLDIFTLVDLRAKLIDLRHGDPAVAITDDEAKALELVCTRVEAFTPAFLFSPGADDFFRSFTNAPTKNPLNGAAKVDSPDLGARV